MEKKKESLHAGHRQRLKEKFLKYGHDVLSDHEFLELMLFFSIPYKNTNEIAHKLLMEFGSFSQLLETEYETIRNLEIKGMADNTACLLKVAMAIVARYNREKNDISKKRITPDNIRFYAKNLFYGYNEEVSFALLLDKECYVKKVKLLSKGTINSAPIYPREVVKFAISYDEPYVMVLHNHPNGITEPSKEDFQVTETLKNALNYVEVRLIDHIIVAGEKVVSMAKDYNFFD